MSAAIDAVMARFWSAQVAERRTAKVVQAFEAKLQEAKVLHENAANELRSATTAIVAAAQTEAQA